MQSNRINVDLLYEIFRHFVAVDRDGPYTLMLVCSQWEELVLAYPPLWSWIYVDDRIEDWKYRAVVNASLARDYPLHCVIHLPFGSIKPEDVQLYVPRIQIFVVVIPFSMEFKIGFRGMKEFLEKLQDADNICLYWIYGNQSEIPDEHWVISSPKSMNTILIERQQSLIGCLHIDATPKLSLKVILSIPPQAPLLNRLVIKAKCIKDSPNLEYTAPIEMPFLRIFIIEVEEDNNIVDHLIRSCIVPRIKTVTLKGGMAPIARSVRELGHIFQAPKIRFSIIYTASYYNIPFTPFPAISTSPSRLAIDIRTKRRLETEELKTLNDLIKCFPGQSELQLELDDNSCDLLTHVVSSDRFIEVDYTGECSRQDHFECLTSPAISIGELITHSNQSLSPFIEKLFIDSSRHDPHSYPARLIPFVRRFSLSKSIQLLDLLLLVKSAPCLQEMEINDLIITTDDIDRQIKIHEESAGIIAPLEYLVFLKTSPILAFVLIQLNVMPQIQTICLYNRQGKPFDTYYSHFERFSEVITTPDEHLQPRCPNFRCLRIPQYLPWGSLFKIAHFVTKNLVDPMGFTIQLPSLPHPSILEPLVGILRGEDPPTNDSFMPWISRSRYDALPSEDMFGCYQCHLGGWGCKELNAFACWRHLFEAWSDSSWWSVEASINKHTPVKRATLTFRGFSLSLMI